MLKEKLINYLKESIKEDIEIEISTPENKNFGHYSTNVALRLAKTLKEDPFEVAKGVKSQITNFSTYLISSINETTVVQPGFINFWLKPEIFQQELKEILEQKSSYAKASADKGKINIEFISANPTGPLTIGNGRGAFLGDVLANILEFTGYKVAREYYINDAKVSNQIKELGKTALGQGESYKTPYIEEKIKKIKFLPKTESEAGYLLAQEVQKENKDFIEKDLKIKIDKWFSEEELYTTKATEKLLKELKTKKLIYEKEGAVWFKSSEFGDNEDRVLVRSTAEPTYFLSDLAYLLDKLVSRKFDQVINIWGADHHGYKPRLMAGLKASGLPNERLKIIITQFARLVNEGKEVKMSKRKGEYITLKDLIEEIGLDAARFFFLMHSPNTHMDFDLGLAKEKSMKNPVYYVQYAGVRAQAILRKSQAPKTKSQINLKLLDTKEDSDLMLVLAKFPEIIEEAAKSYNPQMIIRYAMDLAKEFHNFYEKERIVTDNKELTSARLALINAVLIIFKNTFSILGISLPEKM